MLPTAADSATWDPKLLALSPELSSWRKHYKSNHAACPYHPAATRASPDPLATLDAFVQLVTSDKPATRKEASHNASNVRAFSQDVGHGVWYPGLDLQLSWHGGLLPRPDLPKAAFSPFVEPASRNAVSMAALLRFTEPGSVRAWTRCPVIGPSRLSTGIKVFPAFKEASDADDKKRGAAVIAWQSQRPACLSAEQWLTYGALRCYPLLQMQRLCAALRDSVLAEVLSAPEVRITIASAARLCPSVRRSIRPTALCWVRQTCSPAAHLVSSLRANVRDVLSRHPRICWWR